MAFIDSEITVLPPCPVSGSPDFDNLADAFLPALVVFSTQLEKFRDAINTNVSELVRYAGTYISTTSFSIPEDITEWLIVGSRVYADCGASGIKYATVSTVTYNGSVTTVVVDAAVLLNTLVSVKFFVGNSSTVPNHKSAHATGQRDAIAPTDIGAAPTSHAAAASTYGASTETNFGHVQLATAAPVALGTAAKGTGTRAAKEDHVHPTTGIMLTTHASNSVTGFGTEPGAVSSSTSGTAGTATTVSRGDHSHDLGAHTHVDAATGGSLLATTEPGAVSSSTSGAVGTSTLLARADHSHDLGAHAATTTTYGAASDTNYGHVKLGTLAPTALSGAFGAGSSLIVSREDHVHPTTGLMTDVHAANAITGFGAVSTSVSSSTSAANGTATTIARSDHNHNLGAHTHVSAATGGSLLATTEPPAVSSSTSGAVGTATLLARADHCHDLAAHNHSDAQNGGTVTSLIVSGIQRVTATGTGAAISGTLSADGVSVTGTLDADKVVSGGVNLDSKMFAKMGVSPLAIDPTFQWRPGQEDMPSIVNATRASIATRTNALGLIEQVAADVMREDFDPVTGECLGLLIEEQRTNLFLNSSTPVTQSFTVTAQAYSLSFYGTGTVVLSGTHSATVAGNSDGARKTYTFTPTAGTVTATLSGTITYPQIEVGAFPTSYIPTTSVVAIRYADVVTVSTSAFSYNQGKGSIFVSARTAISVPTTKQIVMMLDYGAGSTSYMSAYRASTGIMYADNAIDGGQYANSSFGNAANKTDVRISTSFDSTTFKTCREGGTVTSVGAATPAGMSTLRLGSGSGATEFWNGHIRHIAYFPRGTSDADLAKLSS